MTTSPHPRRRVGVTTRLSALAVGIALASSMAACGGSGDSAAGSDGGKKPGDIHIAFIGADGSQNFAQEMLQGAKAAGKEFGVDVQALAPTTLDGPAQVKLVQDAMRTATDGLAIETLTPDLLVRPMAQAVSKGIPVVAVDTPPLKGSNVESYVGNDNVAGGKLLGEEAVRLLKAKGVTTGSAVVASSIPGVPTLDERAKGEKEAIEAGLPGFKVVGPVASAADPTTNFTTWNNLVSANSDASVFMDSGDAALSSLARINRDHGNKYLTGAFDLNDAGLAAIKEGVDFATADPAHFLKGYLSVRALILEAEGKEDLFKGWWVTPTVLVTKDNVDDVIKRQAGSAEDKLASFKPTIDELVAKPELRDLP
jgi:ABC-type sugar transport system substrate-binding protein